MSELTLKTIGELRAGFRAGEYSAREIAEAFNDVAETLERSTRELERISRVVGKEGTITHRKAGKGQQEYLVVKMNDIIVTAVTHGGGSEGSSTENVSLAFAKVSFEYKPQKPDGSLDAGIFFKYNIQAQKEE